MTAPSDLALGGPRRRSWLAGSAAAGTAAAAAGAVLLFALSRSRRTSGGSPGASEKAARSLSQSAALLSFTVLADSGLEHFRGRFRNRAMFVAPAVSAAALAAGILGSMAPQHGGSMRTAIYSGALVTGLVGLGFHAYNIGKREGGYGWLNLFYAAPLGAPAAVSLAGLFGLAGNRIGKAGAGSFDFLDVRPGTVLAGAAAAGLAGTVAEVALLHFRGAYQNPFMYLPVSVPPLAAAATAMAALHPGRFTIGSAGALLKATAVLGIAGTGFHSYGIQRNMGGWRNSSQMLLQGPPVPAPIGFTGTALAGLAALSLLEDGSP